MNTTANNDWFHLQTQTCTAAYFPEGMQILKLMDIFGIDNSDTQRTKKLADLLIGVKIRTRSRKTDGTLVENEKVIKSVGGLPGEIEFFDNKRGRKISVTDYFNAGRFAVIPWQMVC